MNDHIQAKLMRGLNDTVKEYLADQLLWKFPSHAPALGQSYSGTDIAAPLSSFNKSIQPLVKIFPCLGTSLVVQWLRLCAPNAGGMGSIPGGGTDIPYAARHGQRKPKNQVLRPFWSRKLQRKGNSEIKIKKKKASWMRWKINCIKKKKDFSLPYVMPQASFVGG